MSHDIKERALTTLKNINLLPYFTGKSLKESIIQDIWCFSSYDKLLVETYLKESIEWILRAQKSSGCGGVAARFTPYTGFDHPYPEVSGYIIPSLLAGYHYFGDERYLTPAISIADWLLTHQLPNGSILCNIISPHKTNTRSISRNVSEIYLFDCGAILEGIIDIWKETSAEKYRTAAINLGDYMVSIQNQNGIWNNSLFFPYFGSHQARTMWILVKAGKVLNKSKYIDAAIKGLEKITEGIQSNGYISNCQFTASDNANYAYLHPLAYTIEGFLKAGIELDNKKYKDIGVTIASTLRRIAEIRQELFYSHYYPNWKPKTKYRCVVSNIQIAMIWLEIAKYTGNQVYVSSAMKFLDIIRSFVIDTKTHIQGIRGGIQASLPIYGNNNPYSFVSWGAKFFIEASLLELEALSRGYNGKKLS